MSPGLRGNVILKPCFLHQAFHTLFGCATPWQAMKMLREQQIDFSSRKRRHAYQILFGSARPNRAIRILNRHWRGRLPTNIATFFRQIA